MQTEKFLKSMQKFWYTFNQTKADNDLLKNKKYDLTLRNNTLRLALRSYICEVASVSSL